ncbi:MAG: nucleoid occlusion protein [Peptococcaceae bacterium]|jgi:ParB family chromosome partitioning protein|nr:nucleoid occlusion protein [Peptococcaceae bacterium]
MNKSASDEKQEKVMDIELGQIRPNPYQPRKHFDQGQLEDLTKSILEMGVIQPITVRRTADYYEIVAGERRYRASLNAGLATIPAVVREFTDMEVAQIALVENLQRADLNYFEEAEGYRRLIDDFTMTQEEVAARVGKSQSTIANKLRILRIDPEVRENIMVELLTERHVRALLKLRDSASQMKVLKEIYEQDMNVRQTEILIEDMLTTDETGPADDEDVLAGMTSKNRQKIIRVIKDIRIYLNSIKAAVQTIEEAGIQVKMAEKNFDDHVEILIHIPKTKR